MSFQEKYVRFKRQHEDHATWKLLKADNAPLILAFVTDLFSQTNELAFDTVVTLLDTELNRMREHGQSKQSVFFIGLIKNFVCRLKLSAKKIVYNLMNVKIESV